MYLLDTNVISLLDPRRARLTTDLVQWIAIHGNVLYLSTMTLTEMEAGILKLRRLGSEARASELSFLLERIIADFGDRVLPMDALTALTVARLAEQVRPRVVELADLIVGATAKRHDLTLLTSNKKHFVGLGITVIDPLTQLPSIS